MTKLLHGNEKNRLNGGREPLFSQKELLVLAVPLLVEQLLEVTVGMADTMMVSRCGEAAISGVSLVDMINNLIIVLFAALATGGAVVVSQYLGAKERGNADIQKRTKGYKIFSRIITTFHADATNIQI